MKIGGLILGKNRSQIVRDRRTLLAMERRGHFVLPSISEPYVDESEMKRNFHYKGKDYQVIGLARHSETEEVLVVYKLLYGDFSLWVRPAAMFNETVTLADGTVVRRFAYVGAS